MQLDTGKESFELIFEGPANEQEDTLRAIRSALVSELGLSVEEAQVLFQNTPSRIRIAESKSELERDLSILLKAGSKAKIHLVSQVPFQFELEDTNEEISTRQVAESPKELTLVPATAPEDFGLTLDLESDAGLPLLEPGLQFAEEEEDIPSPLASQALEPPKEREVSSPSAHFSFDDEEHEASKTVAQVAACEKELPVKDAPAGGMNFSFEDLEEVLQETEAASLRTDSAPRVPEKEEIRELRTDIESSEESETANIPLAKMQKSGTSKIEAALGDRAEEREDDVAHEDSASRPSSFFESRLGVSLLIVSAALIFILGNFVFLASQKPEEPTSFDPKVLAALNAKNLPASNGKLEKKKQKTPEYVVQSVGSSLEKFNWKAEWEVKMNGPSPQSFSWSMEQFPSSELSKEEIVRGEKRKPWIHNLESPEVILRKEQQAWVGEEKAKVYIQDEMERYRIIVPLRVEMKKAEDSTWSVEIFLEQGKKASSMDELVVERDAGNNSVLVALHAEMNFDSPAPVLAREQRQVKK